MSQGKKHRCFFSYARLWFQRVFQRYIDNPLLLRRRKFHIRAYALAVSAIRVYLSHECLALSSGTRYKNGETSNLLAHITNTAYQDRDPNFSEEHCVLLWDETDLAPLLVKDGTCSDSTAAARKISQVLEDMSEITGDLFRAYETEFGVFAPIEGCFEHYGLDFLVDNQWNVYLLEVNPGPDFKQTGKRLQKIVENLMGLTIDLALGNAANDDPVTSSSGKLVLVYESMRQRR